MAATARALKQKSRCLPGFPGDHRHVSIARALPNDGRRSRRPLTRERSIAGRVAYGAGWLVLLRISGRVIGLFSIPILARLLLPVHFGRALAAGAAISANFGARGRRKSVAGKQPIDPSPFWLSSSRRSNRGDAVRGGNSVRACRDLYRWPDRRRLGCSRVRDGADDCFPIDGPAPVGLPRN